MDSVRDPRSIIDRRDLAARLDEIFAATPDPAAARPALLALLKQALADGRTEVRQRFEADHDGRAAAQGLSLLMDQLIRTLHELASVRDVVMAMAASPIDPKALVKNPAFSTTARVASSDLPKQALVWTVLVGAVAVLGILTLRATRKA